MKKKLFASMMAMTMMVVMRMIMTMRRFLS